MRAGLAAIAVGIVLGTVSLPARAADLGLVAPAPAIEGVPCESDAVQTFPSIWRGHFTGTRSIYPGPGSHILLEYHDKTLCFPSARACSRFIGTMRSAFHRPEGYFTCLPIR